MSIKRIDNLIELLKSEQWRPRLARRILIPKPNGKTRPLGIQGPEEKLVQEVMRMILEAIYEPCFHHFSHGFRTNKSCHTAINQIRENFDGVQFIIEGDFSKCFDTKF
jgi:retron-type reverse transcriptase